MIIMIFCGIYRAMEERKEKKLPDYDIDEDVYDGLEESLTKLSDKTGSGISPCEIRRDIDD